MTLNIEKALAGYELADLVDLNCGTFDIRICQAAVHNEDFRAAVAKRSMAAKRRSLMPEKGSITGNFVEDVELFVDLIIKGWGDRPLMDDDGEVVPWTKANGMALFTSSKKGKVLFSKVMVAATEDELFLLRDEDRGNS